jgi:O-antigen biosynthesis protein
VFLDNDEFITQHNWLRLLVNEVLGDPDVGMVGASLLYPDGTVWHGGLVLEIGGIAEHRFKGLGLDAMGYIGRAPVTQKYSLVTAGCALCRASVFAEISGFDEVDFGDVF